MMPHQGAGGNIGGQQLFGPGAGLQAMSAAGYPGMINRAMYGMGGQAQFLPQQQQQHGQGWHPQQQQGGQQWNQGFS
jgi:hypothetical protein